MKIPVLALTLWLVTPADAVGQKSSLDGKWKGEIIADAFRGAIEFEPRSFYYEPKGAWQYTRPVLVLTSRRTVSAGENFLLGMRLLPHVTLVGDVTSGAFADVGHFKLANGWEVSFPYNQFLDSRGFSWEGVGLAPDIRVVPSRSDIAAGRDPVLDVALRAARTLSAKR